MKTCTQCRRSRPNKAFPPDKRHSDGLYAWCRDCHSAHVRASRESQRIEWGGLYERAMARLNPTPEEMDMLTRALARWGKRDPTADDVLCEFYGTQDHARERPGMASLLSLMARVADVEEPQAREAAA